MNMTVSSHQKSNVKKLFLNSKIFICGNVQPIVIITFMSAHAFYGWYKIVPPFEFAINIFQ